MKLIKKNPGNIVSIAINRTHHQVELVIPDYIAYDGSEIVGFGFGTAYQCINEFDMCRDNDTDYDTFLYEGELDDNILCDVVISWDDDLIELQKMLRHLYRIRMLSCDEGMYLYHEIMSCDTIDNAKDIASKIKIHKL